MTKMLTPIVKECKIKLLTGLHIGGADQGLKIGGIDSSVIKNPITGEPIIPGSSIKGKMRALIEMIEYGDKIDEKGNSIQDPDEEVAKVFGCSYSNKENKKQVNISSRLIFEDFYLSRNDDFVDGKSSFEIFEEMKSDFFEDKAENSVPRFLKGTANPRHIERVPAGVEFEGKIVLLPHEGEYAISEDELNKILNKGIDYLNKNYLGGGGTRGNGRIELIVDN
ncbi:type III-A CRISPR-associated RAMP protein Csm3 [Candidatus Absconditicoccus praedator]|uniref:type III-A CRISPR-associated RAMP protein Csm3 n=1 Tax=Candidatus Absconditicoccus praedator TaxID=2735562 RepID=UPI001E6097A2|nr:type III-A CRISPR-associated RAMP protein Csm3 [Candidatus Absconditicoccus praedator]UFX83260.1 type III-A CRISPR-associated RAMP protein Csm3 [Candidatus Absconditicoccus praedator]